MTKRAKLSLEPTQRTRDRPPPHGFDESPEPTDQPGGPAHAPDPEPRTESAPSIAGAASETPKPRAAGAPWEADRPRPEPGEYESAPARPLPGASRAGRDPDAVATPASAAAVVKALARSRTVRAAAVGIAAGLSLYLLKRRFF